MAIPMPVSPVPIAALLAKYETSSCPAVHSVTRGAATDVLMPSLVVVLSVDGELEHPAAHGEIAATTAAKR